MFIWDFVAGSVMDEIIDWFYAQLVGFLGNFFSVMGGMGIELFEMTWVQGIVRFFFLLAWALYMTGLVVSCFECGIGYASGRGNFARSAQDALKGLLAVSLFSVVPVRLYALAVSLQGSLTAEITGLGTSIGDIASTTVSVFGEIESITSASPGMPIGSTSFTNPIMLVFVILLMGYAVIKVFLANLMRGGILLIQIAVGSLHMFSIPRGYFDGFYQWCKQVIGLCLTAFLQSTLLIAGLMVFQDHPLIGLGVMLSASKVPQIAASFGLDTSFNATFNNTVTTARNISDISRGIVKRVV